ncbi:NAD(P)H-dependent oxidoreductase [Halarcobacter ebronensis]|uniref:Flavodoxin n=1 Tax=Halarcobacter ebronensis TaxID=1462615 RepID=A0A4Q1AF64_9BACT|nr:NAD(P)H-dependent oxidoreductase [Halarcobacter ebronensis]QKF81869.1 flavodoxin-like fold domain-containing protein, putative NAD(P)H (quinone) dehydrogenase/reductase [Halarcobacter ebronensis]RXK02135.1 flavodoxin [Halarcobacter ebronensis]
MKKILIINGHQYYDVVAKGELTEAIINRAKDFFDKNGFEVKYTHIEKGYEKSEEIEKLEWADYLLFQYPVYWMSMPWLAKKYFDEVLTQGKHYASDGRSRSDASKTYGSGGLLKGKYMLSLTYNCPTSEFNNKDGFFDGLSLDEANIAVHKIFQFCGLEPLETYSVHDIFKGNMDLEAELKRLDVTLEKNFK